MDPEIMMLALRVPQGSRAHGLAMQLCVAKGLDPYGYGNGFGMANWQAMIAESLLRVQLDDALRSGQ